MQIMPGDIKPTEEISEEQEHPWTEYLQIHVVIAPLSPNEVLIPSILACLDVFNSFQYLLAWEATSHHTA